MGLCILSEDPDPHEVGQSWEAAVGREGGELPATLLLNGLHEQQNGWAPFLICSKSGYCLF
uniref:Uncharacterized protein n=1 Tax=Oryza sativa subsp. japonica TaxID=39947 RepID=Q84YN7_ORYSJ|nr:hypothetical protein [Oryza sativa Japonica Group]BAD31188.1 hypothetical protein [Oryza sativa Japonica Group]